MRGRFDSRGTRKHNLYGGRIFIATTQTQTPYRDSGRRATVAGPSVVDSRNYPKSTERGSSQPRATLVTAHARFHVLLQGDMPDISQTSFSPYIFHPFSFILLSYFYIPVLQK